MQYSVESDQLVGYQRVLLDDVDSLEIGMEPKLIGAKKMVIRINYHIDLETGYYHQFRTAGIRFFNSIVMPVSSDEESLGTSYEHELQDTYCCMYLELLF